VRVPNFSPPPPAQRVANTNTPLPSSSNEPQTVLRSFAAERKRQERAAENEQQRARRLADDRLRKVSARENEDESERNTRLAYHRRHQEATRQNEDENQRIKRLAEKRLHEEAARATESAEKAHERVRSISVRRRQRSLENKSRANPDSLQWPRAISAKQKDQCLQDFVKRTSMPMLKQAVCAVCNLRTFVSSMNEYDVNQIPNQARLVCHPDLLGIVPGTGSVPQGSPRRLIEPQRDSLSF
jgi:flagellar biosynthesis GTPase FlhF